VEKDEKNILENYLEYYVKLQESPKHTTTTEDIWKEVNKE
jgi:hypothetical protein